MTADEILTMFNDYIAALPYERKPASLYDPIRYVLSMGGKRIRPTLMLLSYNLFKDDPGRYFRQLVRWKLTITILSCMMTLWTRLRCAVAIRPFMRSGTPMSPSSLATPCLSSLISVCFSARKTRWKPVLDLFTETALEIGEGQQYDMEFETRTDVREEEYIEMIRLKTSVLLACAMKIGAILADAPEEDAENLYKFGEQIGLAFQLQDDYLDVYGNTATFGKAIGGDILSNKKTFMLINAFNHADDCQRKELMRWITATDFNPKEKIAAVTDLYNKMGIDKLAIEKINCYFEQGRKYLDSVTVPTERKTELERYTDKMMHREK